MHVLPVFRAFRHFFSVALSFAVGIFLVTSAADAQTPLLWGGLTAGPHAVGFRLRYAVDHSREYDPDFEIDTTQFPAHRPRPIMIAMWYPARTANAAPMTYGQYLELSSGAGPLAPFARRLEPHMRNVVGLETTGRMPRAMTPAETGAFERLLATKTFAVKDAPTATGRFPVIIYHAGSSGSYEDNSVLFEYLASRGYVVLSSAYPDPDASGVAIDGTLAASFADLDFLVTFARTLPGVDADRLGVMGHSYGAYAVFGWAAKEGSPVRALITLDSGFEYDSLNAGPEQFQFHMKVHRDNIRAATLRVASTERTPHFEYLDPYLKFAPRYEAAITSLTHNDYLTHGAIRPALMPETWSDPKNDRRASYDRMSEVICNFLDASLKQRAQAKALLLRSVEEKGSDNRMSLQFRAPAPRPPNQREMAKYLRQYGPEKAAALLRAFPGARMTGGIMALLDEDDVKTALPSLVVAEKIHPESAAIHAMLGKVLARTGDKTGAEKAYRRALVLLPNDTSVGALRPYWKNEIERGLRELGFP
jgi:pimeloyl-ACP methyl ester carboxylesterase